MPTSRSVPFLQTKLFFWELSSNGASADPDKIGAIVEWLEPCNIREVKFSWVSHFLQAVYPKF